MKFGQYGAAEFLSVHEYKNVVRWADAIGARPAVQRGRMVNRLQGEPSSQLHERHDASDFEDQDAGQAGGGRGVIAFGCEAGVRGRQRKLNKEEMKRGGREAREREEPKPAGARTPPDLRDLGRGGSREAGGKAAGSDDAVAQWRPGRRATTQRRVRKGESGHAILRKGRCPHPL